jgi:hypothetical protein
LFSRIPALALLRLHYVRWALFDDDTRFICMAIFDTNFDEYVEDVLTLLKRVESAGVIPLFASHRRFPSGLEGESRRIREVDSRGSCPIFRRICEVIRIRPAWRFSRR